MPKLVLLWTDGVVFALVALLTWYVWHVRRRPDLRARWLAVFQDGPALGGSIVIALGLLVALVDSVHFRPRLDAVPGAAQAAYDTRTLSLLDVMLRHLVDSREATYSAPLATHGFTRESVIVDGVAQRVHPRLRCWPRPSRAGSAPAGARPRRPSRAARPCCPGAAGSSRSRH